jgi:hypothetical protein
MRHAFTALAIVSAFVAPAPAGAGSSLLHAGQNDPASEGFIKYVVGTDPGPSPGNDGMDYWAVDGSGGDTSFYYYYVDQFDATLNAILAAPGGWVLSATARVVSATGGGFPSVVVSDPFPGGGSGGGDTWYFALIPNAGNPSQSTLSYLNNVDELTPLTNLDVGEYHDYEFTLLPGANPAGFDDEVEVRVDGALVGTVTRSFITDQNVANTLRFGHSAVGKSHSRWNRVEFTAVPEPGQPLLLLAAAVALRLVRARRVSIQGSCAT